MKSFLARVGSALAVGLLASHAAPAAPPVAARTQVFRTSAGTVKITPLYRGSARIEAGNKVIYLDPAKPFEFKQAPKADLITDVDEEHMDQAAVADLKKPGTDIVSTAAAIKTFPAAWPMNNGENKTWHGWTIEAVPNYIIGKAYAPAKCLREKGHANGYVLTYGEKRFYFSGASAGVPELRELKNIDVAFVIASFKHKPCSMGRWGPAATATAAFLPKIVIPYQYGDSDLQILRMQLRGADVEIRLVEGRPE